MDERARVLGRAYGDAEAFRRYWAGELGQAGSRLIAGLDLGSARRVLDLGAGIGVNVPRLSAEAPRATLVAADYVETMIRAAPPAAARIVMDAARLGFADGAFDAALMAFMLFHTPSPAEALTEVRRVLRPAGAIAVGTWAIDAQKFKPDEVWNEELAARGIPPVNEAFGHHEMMDTPSKVAALLEAAGFSDVSTDSGSYEDPFYGADEYIRRRTKLGMASARFEGLPQEHRAHFLQTLRARLGAFGSDAFVAHETAIFAWARA